GPDGLRAIAERTHAHASTLAAALRAGGVTVEHDTFFDTVRAVVPGRAAAVVAAAADAGINPYTPDADPVQTACHDTTTPARAAAVVAAAADAGINLYNPDADHVQIACDETTPPATVADVLSAFGVAADGPATAAGAAAGAVDALPAELRRETGYLQHPIFHL